MYFLPLKIMESGFYNCHFIHTVLFVHHFIVVETKKMIIAKLIVIIMIMIIGKYTCVRPITEHEPDSDPSVQQIRLAYFFLMSCLE